MVFLTWGACACSPHCAVVCTEICAGVLTQSRWRIGVLATLMRHSKRERDGRQAAQSTDVRKHEAGGRCNSYDRGCHSKSIILGNFVVTSFPAFRTVRMTKVFHCALGFVGDAPERVLMKRSVSHLNAWDVATFEIFLSGFRSSMGCIRISKLQLRGSCGHRWKYGRGDRWAITKASLQTRTENDVH